MQKKTQLFIVTMLFVLLLFPQLGTAGSQNMGTRMRQPQIKALKAQGFIGENNLGYLEYRSSSKMSENVVRAENRDRKKEYQAIADQQETSIEEIGSSRAAQIASRAQSGTWLQDDDGEWFRK